MCGFGEANEIFKAQEKLDFPHMGNISCYNVRHTLWICLQWRHYLSGFWSVVVYQNNTVWGSQCPGFYTMNRIKVTGRSVCLLAFTVQTKQDSLPDDRSCDWRAECSFVLNTFCPARDEPSYPAHERCMMELNFCFGSFFCRPNPPPHCTSLTEHLLNNTKLEMTLHLVLYVRQSHK